MQSILIRSKTRQPTSIGLLRKPLTLQISRTCRAVVHPNSVWKRIFLELQPCKDDPRGCTGDLRGKDSSDGGYSTLFAGEDPLAFRPYTFKLSNDSRVNWLKVRKSNSQNFGSTVALLNFCLGLNRDCYLTFLPGCLNSNLQNDLQSSTNGVPCDLSHCILLDQPRYCLR
jgi:hypothetical protein